jgi:ubiquinone/menaquinone biosynthesis C-methylase UbiE
MFSNPLSRSVSYPATSKMISSSTGVPSGRLATPYTRRPGSSVLICRLVTTTRYSFPVARQPSISILLLMQPDREVISVWRNSAPFWEKHREVIRQMFAPVTQALIEDGLIGRGHTVLDIATGPGEPALTIARLVGPEGKVFGIDPVPEMVEAARRGTDHLGFGNVQFDVGSAESLPFPTDTFDAVVSRFGVMFFPSPVDAVREMLRVLKPGRKLALAVWHFAERNPFHYALWRVIERYIDSPRPAPDAPDAFRFATPGKLRDVLTEAGAIGQSERLLQFTVQAQISVEDFWTLRCEMSEKLRGKIAMLSKERLTEVKRQPLEALRGYSTDRGMSFPAEVLIVSGTKSRPT